MTKRESFVVTRDRPIAELITERLNEITTRFGRLLYLARCVDPHGRYRHDGLRLTHDRAIVHEALLSAHEKCFEEWLELPLAEQHADLTAFLSGLNRRRVVQSWSESAPWTWLAPPSAEAHQRELFAADLRALLAGLLGSR